jgi:hypothetical protein
MDVNQQDYVFARKRQTHIGSYSVFRSKIARPFAFSAACRPAPVQDGKKAGHKAKELALPVASRLPASKLRQASDIGRNIKRNRHPHLHLSPGLHGAGFPGPGQTDAHEVASFPVCPRVLPRSLRGLRIGRLWQILKLSNARYNTYIKVSRPKTEDFSSNDSSRLTRKSKKGGGFLRRLRQFSRLGVLTSSWSGGCRTGADR